MPVESIAVVISTYNQPDFLRLTLEGYRQQSDLNFTIHIADDGSGEETRTVIQAIQSDFPVAIHHHWQPDNGFRKARIHNRAIADIKAPYTLLTDGDCIPMPGLIAAHRKFSDRHYFISGSRLLLSQSFTKSLCSRQNFVTSRSTLWWTMQRIRGNMNRLFPLLLPASISPPGTKLAGIRGCHLLVPTDALHRINGFDESFEGWGREDSDLTARLLHAGLKRRNLRGQPVLHLWHREASRNRLPDNDEQLAACLTERRIEAVKGINQVNN